MIRKFFKKYMIIVLWNEFKTHVGSVTLLARDSLDQSAQDNLWSRHADKPIERHHVQLTKLQKNQKQQKSN